MTSSMPIPKRKQPARAAAASSYPSNSSVSSSASSTSLPQSPSHNHNRTTNPPHTPSAKAQGKAPVTDDLPPPSPATNHERRRSLLGRSLGKSEYTVVNLGDCEGGRAPRLVTCVKAGQGFDWNQELFLPSYVDYEGQNLERKMDPVEDIVLTDEEADGLLPR
ncbi:hypothetical protein MBLNU230_g0815t1 [Neophaeotheca triangularis]